MLSRILLGLLVYVYAVVSIIPTSAQAERGSRCKALRTAYSELLPEWQWENSDSVIFGVTSGGVPNSIFVIRNAWYHYIISTDKLKTLDNEPYNQLNVAPSVLSNLKDVEPGLGGKYERVSISPSGRFVVYPRKQGDTYEIWFLDTQKNRTVSLGIKAGSTSAVWSQDEQHIILPAPGYSNFYSPIYLVSLKDDVPEVQPISQIPVLGNLLVPEFEVQGISPDGRYILIQPQMYPLETWIFDLNTKVTFKTTFLIYGMGPVVWVTPTTFISVTDIGAVRYDVVSQRLEQLATPIELGSYEPTVPDDALIIGAGSLSPDGHYMLATSQQGSKQNVVVCKIF